MKKIILILLIVAYAFLQGCVVKSLYSFYEKENVIFTDNLLGYWIDNDSLIWCISRFTNNMSIKITTEENLPAYLISLKEEKGNIKDLYLAHLFVFNNEYYVDLQSIDNNSLFNAQVNAHVLAKVEIDANVELILI